MSRYLVIYEENEDAWWAYLPDLPGCTATGSSRREVEERIGTALTAHLELLRMTGKPVPEPSAQDAGHVAAR